jgi:predicted membrane protein
MKIVNQTENENFFEEKIKRSKSPLGRILGGLVVVLIGTVLLIHKLGLKMPDWLFSFEMFLIAIGIFISARHEFRTYKGLIVILIGLLLLVDKYFFIDISIQKFFWPIFVIVAGLVMIFKPKTHRTWHTAFAGNNDAYNGDDYIDIVSVFSGVEKKFTSKQFKGGEITTAFGGTEIDLTKVEMEYPQTIKVNVAFGGVSIIVPQHWNVSSEVVSIFGGVEDSRITHIDEHGNNNLIILKGNTIFGGIEIKS